MREGFAPLSPDAVFEVRSKSITLAELRDKLRAYLANGARIAVLIDPGSETTEVWRPGKEPAVNQGTGPVDLAPDLPGLWLDVGSIFAE